MNLWTSLDAIRAHSPCESGWQRLLKYLGKTRADAEPLHLSTIARALDWTDVRWVITRIGGDFSKAFAQWNRPEMDRSTIEFAVDIAATDPTFDPARPSVPRVIAPAPDLAARVAALEARIGSSLMMRVTMTPDGQITTATAPTPSPAPEPERHKWDAGLRVWGESVLTLRQITGTATSQQAGVAIADELTRQHREILALRRERDEAAKAERQRIAGALEMRAKRSIPANYREAYELAARLIRANDVNQA